MRHFEPLVLSPREEKPSFRREVRTAVSNVKKAAKKVAKRTEKFIAEVREREARPKKFRSISLYNR